MNVLIEARLLLQAVCAGRAGSLLLQGQMHALMAAVLVWLARFDALELDARRATQISSSFPPTAGSTRMSRARCSSRIRSSSTDHSTRSRSYIRNHSRRHRIHSHAQLGHSCSRSRRSCRTALATSGPRRKGECSPPPRRGRAWSPAPGPASLWPLPAPGDRRALQALPREPLDRS
jgi:hypothetical protein